MAAGRGRPDSLSKTGFDLSKTGFDPSVTPVFFEVRRRTRPVAVYLVSIDHAL